jgi:hypothetical protein
MALPFDNLPPHRRLVAFMETALDCLDEAVEADAYLPHWAQVQVREMAEDLEALLERVAHEAPALGPLTESEWGDEPDA